jgi:hypothetical protein
LTAAPSTWWSYQVARANELRRDPSFISALERARALETELLTEPVSVSGFVNVGTARVATAAGGLADFEVEFRRAVLLVADLSPSTALPYDGSPKAGREDAPLPPAEGGLQIDYAASGSPLDVLVGIYGSAQAVLLSSPLQVALTLHALVGDLLHIRLFRRRRHADGSVAVETIPPTLAAQVDQLMTSLQPADPRGTRLRELYAEFETTQADGSSLVMQLGVRREPPPPAPPRDIERRRR